MAVPPEARSDSAASVAKAEKGFGTLRIVLLLVVLGLGGLGWLVGGWIGMLVGLGIVLLFVVLGLGGLGWLVGAWIGALVGLGIGVVVALGVVLVAGLFFAMTQDNR